ncbi:MAG: arrestin family protein, partial [Thaumarchaeota archaeon]|nr:arrestin family protein [Nitrososphaerota archaeon]
MSVGLEPEPHRRRPDDHLHIYSAARGAVVYTPRPRNLQERKAELTAANSPPSFPTPHIRPRARRPNSIHIVSYPSGYVPRDVRPRPQLQQSSPSRRKTSSSRPHKNAKEAAGEKPQQEKEKVKKSSKTEESKGAAFGLGGDHTPNRVLEKLFATFGPQPTGPRSPTTGETSQRPGPAPVASQSSTSRQQQQQPRWRQPGYLSLRRRLSRIGTVREEESMNHTEIAPAMVEALRPGLVAATAHPSYRRNSIMSSVRSVKNITSSSVTEVPKPAASGSGVSCSILLAEPNIFLTGFDHDGHTRHESHNSTALLRGKLQLSVSKDVKIKSVALKLVGKARTEWPEGIPPLKADLFEETSLRTQVLTFFHAMHEAWETEYGNQCTYKLKSDDGPMPMPIPNPSANRVFSISPSRSAIPHHLPTWPRGSEAGVVSARELKKLSLQSAQSRSFGKGDSPMAANQPQARGFKVFCPGTYEYSFELPIDHHQLESIKLQYGSVKWELETTVERAGPFKPNLHGTREVSVVRVPDQMSLELTEPISISRQWEDQLHYDIIISGKSFPIGAKIPIAFKLTPLAKVQVHKLKVLVTESIEYSTNDHRVTRKDRGRKVLLVEKAAGKPLDKA